MRFHSRSHWGVCRLRKPHWYLVYLFVWGRPVDLFLLTWKIFGWYFIHKACAWFDSCDLLLFVLYSFCPPFQPGWLEPWFGLNSSNKIVPFDVHSWPIVLHTALWETMALCVRVYISFQSQACVMTWTIGSHRAPARICDASLFWDISRSVRLCRGLGIAAFSVNKCHNVSRVRFYKFTCVCCHCGIPRLVSSVASICHRVKIVASDCLCSGLWTWILQTR